MRSILIDWLVQVHSKFQLIQETLYITVDLIDRFLQVFVRENEILIQIFIASVTHFLLFNDMMVL